jgi:hypothetical protein
MSWLWIVGIVIYFIFVAVDIAFETTTDVKFHQGGFLGLGYTTCGKRETEPKDVWWALIWPFRFVWWFACGVFSMLFDVICCVFLAFGFRLKDTKFFHRFVKRVYYC